MAKGRPLRLKLAGSLVSLALVLSTFAATTAQAQDQNGELSWGVKRSFVEYVANIARGEVDTRGASFRDFTARFPQSQAQLGADALGTVSYSGEVKFTGHNQTLLILRNPVITIDSVASARLIIDVGTGPVHFANLNLSAGTKAESGSLLNFRAVPTTLTAAGATAFSDFYEVGEQLDRISFSIQTAAPKPSPTPSATASASNGDTAANSESGAGSSTATNGDASPEPGIGAEGEGDAADTSAEALTTAPGSLSANSEAALAKLDELATARSACSPAQYFDWSVKESFLAYLDSDLAKGGWQPLGVTETGANFRWPLASAELQSDESFSISASGAIWFFGHDQQLSLVMANPTINSDGLFIDFYGESMTGSVTNSSQLRIADLVGIELSDTESGVDVIATLALSEAGASAFGFYAVGTELAPVRLSLSPQTDCVQLAAAADERAGLSPALLLALLAALASLAAGAAWWWLRQRRNSGHPNTVIDSDN